MGAVKSKRKDVPIVNSTLSEVKVNHAPWIAKPASDEVKEATRREPTAFLDPRLRFCYIVFVLRNLADTTRTVLPMEIIVAIVRLCLLTEPASLDYFEVRCQLGTTLRRTRFLLSSDYFSLTL
jgi:hypothetical protein